MDHEQPVRRSSVFYVARKKKGLPPTLAARLRQGLNALLLAAVLAVLAYTLLPRPAQDTVNLAGAWYGMIYQQPGALSSYYDLRVTFTQDGDQISGTARVNVTGDSTEYGVMSLTGYRDGDTLHYTETGLLESGLSPDWRWCFKNATLTLNGDTLSGRWSSPGCNPGTMTLVRENAGPE
ncbi:MAG: hypothetical protein MUE40_20065 [Anaerolineae bacterium]|nr:hypothetical protein [Anaerolineae bacterium]